MLKNKYFSTSLGLYMNYFVQGIQAIIISQNINNFAENWNTTTAGVMGVIAATGIGKIIVLLFSGMLADKFGRKPIALIGMIGYICFFGGLILCNNLTLAYVVAFTAGAATSFLDGATYPALMEIYPDRPSVASVIVKGFIAAGGVAPLFISFLRTNNLWYGWSLVLPLVVVAVNFIFMMTAKFPDIKGKEVAKEEKAEEAKFASKPKFYLEGIFLMAYAFFIFGTFYLWQQTSTLYAVDIVGMSDVASSSLVTIYSLGSFIAVLLTSVIMSKGIKDITVMIVYGLVATLLLAMVYLIPSQLTLTIGSFGVGFFAAGGVLQIGNAMLSQFFPEGKGRNTSLYNVFMAGASYVVPVLVQTLMAGDFTRVMLLAVAFSTVCFVLALLIGMRYSKVFGAKIGNKFGKTADVSSK
ncbi:MFS transporter [Enterococcus sp. LJL90]